MVCSPKKTKEKNQQTGGILMGVFRGRASEGYNFSDQFARAVVVLGIPYPNISDIQVCYTIK